MVRLIATDLDGTFLSGPQSVDPLNVAAVREAAAAGIPTLYCTGRPERWLGFLTDVGAHSHAITSNGAQIIDLDSGAIEHAWPLPDAELRESVALIRRALPHATFALEWGDEFGSELELNRREWDEYFVAPVEELLDHRPRVLKLLVRHVGIPSDQLAPQIAAILAGRLACTYSWVSPDGLAEIAAPGISKAVALETWANAHGHTAADTAAFGDMPNDLEMLRWAGQAFVMPTAHASLRDGRFTVVDGDQPTAVGRTIRRLLG